MNSLAVCQGWTPGSGKVQQRKSSLSLFYKYNTHLMPFAHLFIFYNILHYYFQYGCNRLSGV